ncbi:MAG: MaoC family dehydratase [Hyphomicrobiaceae bacterium]
MDGKRTIVASYGRYFEDFEVDDVYEHRPGRTITEADNIQFSLITMNRHPLHSNNDYASKTEFGKPLVNSALTLAIVTGMTVDDVSFKATANLGWREIKLTAPVFPGDTIYARSKVLAKRESKSRPHEGIVTTYTEGYKADGTVFLSFERISLVPKRGHGPAD